MHWLLRKEKLCDGERVCPDSPDQVSRCSFCALTKLEDAMEGTDRGQCIHRALMLRSAIDLGVTVTLEDIPADEFNALIVVKRELAKYEAECHRERSAE